MSVRYSEQETQKRITVNMKREKKTATLVLFHASPNKILRTHLFPSIK